MMEIERQKALQEFEERGTYIRVIKYQILLFLLTVCENELKKDRVHAFQQCPWKL